MRFIPVAALLLFLLSPSFSAAVETAPAPNSDKAPATMPEPASREQRDKLIAKARERAQQDAKKYSKEQLQECENLYQVANKNWRTPEAVTTLKVMVEKYPDVNRTGCAVLYLAQMSTGKDRETRLNDAIQKYSDCRYLNGAQVGALARYYLAVDLWAAGDKTGAGKLFSELAEKYPDAISHKGVLLSALVDLVKASPSPAVKPTDK